MSDPFMGMFIHSSKRNFENIVKPIDPNNFKLEDVQKKLVSACEHGLVDTVRDIFETYKIECPDLGFLRACNSGHVDVIKVCIENSKCNLTRGLHFACKHGHIDAARLLIEKGADISILGEVIDDLQNGGYSSFTWTTPTSSVEEMIEFLQQYLKK